MRNNKIIKAWKLSDDDESTMRKFYDFLLEEYPYFKFDGYKYVDIMWDTYDVIFLDETHEFGRTEKLITWTMESVYNDYENAIPIELYGKSVFREKRLKQILTTKNINYLNFLRQVLPIIEQLIKDIVEPYYHYPVIPDILPLIELTKRYQDIVGSIKLWDIVGREVIRLIKTYSKHDDYKYPGGLLPFIAEIDQRGDDEMAYYIYSNFNKSILFIN